MSEKDRELEEIIAQAMKKKSESTAGSLSETKENTQNQIKPVEDKPTKKKWTGKKKIITGILIFLGIVLILGGIALGIVFHYIDKMNLVGKDYDNSVYDSISELDPTVENPDNEPDSPEYEIYDLEQNISENIQSNAERLQKSDDVMNILLIGTDARTSDYRGRSDSMILMSINEKTEQIVFTSIMRDIYVSIPGKENNRINAAYAFGGPALLIETIEENFGIAIDKFMQVDFNSFESVIDAVGGVDIYVNDRELSQVFYSGEDGAPSAEGTYKLDGVHALRYARIRHIGNADFERTQRQRTVLEEIFAQAKSLSIGEMTDFLDEILPLITTDLSKNDVFSLIVNSPEYLSYERVQLRIPADGMYSGMRINGRSVLGIDFEESSKLLIDTIYGD